MNIRRFIRLSCLSVASLFWASCDSDSSPQAPAPEIPDPDSSNDSVESSSSEDASLSSSATGSSFSEMYSSSSSTVENVPSSSETVTSSSSNAASSSSTPQYVLASDASVTCEKQSYRVAACSSTKSLTCDDYKKYLASDTTLSEKLLTEWESKLQKCGAILEPVALYGIVYDPCATAYYDKIAMKCSNGNTYKDFELDGNKVYTSTEEYNKAHGISSSSVAESSSSVPEDLVQNCPQEGFALFADILADVQKELYEQISMVLEVPDLGLTEAQKQFYEGLLDRENKKLKGNLSPYYMDEYDYDVMSISLRYDSKNWFDGYIAKTKTCSDGTPVITERYQEMFNAIYQECLKILDAEINQITE